jgi:hypothetical protein
MLTLLADTLTVMSIFCPSMIVVSAPAPTKLTVLLTTTFSLYVPGLTFIVSPSVAPLIACWIDAKEPGTESIAPKAVLYSTTPFSTLNEKANTVDNKMRISSGTNEVFRTFSFPHLSN